MNQTKNEESSQTNETAVIASSKPNNPTANANTNVDTNHTHQQQDASGSHAAVAAPGVDSNGTQLPLLHTTVAVNSVRTEDSAPKTQRVYEERVLCGLSKSNPLRKLCIFLASSRYFDAFIILVIVVNSLLLGMTDYSVVDPTDLSPSSTGVSYVNGQMVNVTSFRNRILENVEVPFTSIFTAEAIIKIIAMGFIKGNNAYLKDSWNLLDFTVVVSSLIAILPNMPNVSAIRTIRILRPLRSLSMVPGMRKLITALLEALPALGNVLIVQIFVFFIYGILGIQLFEGNLTFRCRTTPWPVKLEINETTGHGIFPPSDTYLATVIASPLEYKCINGSNVDLSDHFTMSTSPWHTPRECFWPLELENEHVCALDGQSGNYKCPKPKTTCGSDYDAFGNPRFVDPKAVKYAFFVPDLSFGYTSFDNIFIASMTIFQIITQEGWTQIMYETMDSASPLVGAAFFVSLIMFGGFFLMNLTLAVIADEFSVDEEAEAAAKQANNSSITTARGGGDNGSKPPGALQSRHQHLHHHSLLNRIVSSGPFSGFIMLAIVANTVVLSLDHYPMPPGLDSNLEIINFGLSCIFFSEMIMKLIGLGPKLYCKDRFNLFDAFVVTMGILEMAMSPPSFMSSNPTKKGAVSALRGFRLFRVFKLARNWRSLRELLSTIGRTLVGIANFGVLLFLFMYIYALLGLQFFANQYHFDADNYVMYPHQEGFWDGVVPRSNFDSFTRAFATVFQVITGENWNNLLYDGIRCNGFIASLYFIILMIIGKFILMNLFLALLLDNFATDDTETPQEKAAEILEMAKRATSMKVLPLLKSEKSEHTLQPLERCASSRTKETMTAISDRRASIQAARSVHAMTAASAANLTSLGTKAAIKSSKSTRSLLGNDPPKDNAKHQVAAAEEKSPVRSGKPMEPTVGVATSKPGGEPATTVVTSKGEEPSVEHVKTVDLEKLDKDLDLPPQAATTTTNPLSKPSTALPLSNPSSVASAKTRRDIRRATIDQDNADLDPLAETDSSKGKSKRRMLSPDDRSQAGGSSGAVNLNITMSRPGSASNSMAGSVGKALPNAAEHNDDDDEVYEFLPPAGKSFFLFSERNKYRKFAFRLISHPRFESLVLTLIIASSISLALDNPLANAKAVLPQALKILDKVFTVLFLIEMLLKLFALGVVGHKGSYMRNNWNLIDGTIVVSSVVMLILDQGGSSDIKGVKPNKIKSLRSLRGLRTFRPLRMVSRYPGLKLVVNSLFEAIPSVGNVIFVCSLFYLIFSIVAVNYLKGTFNACQGDVFDNLTSPQTDFLVNPVAWNATNDEQKSWFIGGPCEGFPNATDASKLTSKMICQCFNATWDSVVPLNFDSVPAAMLTFYDISTTEGWVDVMNAAVDSTGIDMQPVRDNDYKWIYFFIFFIIVGSFFVVNLLVGVIIDNFNRMKAALGGDFMLTPEQKKWIEAKRAASRIGPIRINKPPPEPWRRTIFDIVKTTAFEWMVMVCIISNTLLMAAEYFGQSELQDLIIGIINDVFAFVFTSEAVLKLIAYGRGYFKDFWNQFDFLIVLGTFLSIIMEQLMENSNLHSLTMLARIFRVTRILRLVKASKSIRQILQTLYIALPQLSNISAILFLVLFIYATMGIQIFAKTALNGCIDSHANFQSFWAAMLLLLRASTGEAWDYCMVNFAENTDGCDEDPEYNETMCGFNNFDGCLALNGCGNWLAYPYFTTFTFLVTFVMLNLTIAVILEGFSSSQEDEEPLFEPELLDEFRTKWADLDPDAKGFLNVSFLQKLIQSIDAPLGKNGKEMTKIELLAYMDRLDLQLYEGETIVFRDVLIAMTREMVRETAVANANDFAEPKSNGEEDLNNSRRRIDFLAHEFFAARSIQMEVKRWVRIKRKLEKRYMEEYKNKIKKPSGRPKKVRDARVYTIQ